MIKFEDLKVGDKIRQNSNTAYEEVVALGPDVVSLYLESHGIIESLLKAQFDKEDYSYYTPPKKMKQVVMSPAVVCDASENFYPKFSTSQRLYRTKDEAEEDQDIFFYSWPAKDAAGRPIQILVEVEE